MKNISQEWVYTIGKKCTIKANIFRKNIFIELKHLFDNFSFIFKNPKVSLKILAKLFEGREHFHRSENC